MHNTWGRSLSIIQGAAFLSFRNFAQLYLYLHWILTSYWTTTCPSNLSVFSATQTMRLSAMTWELHFSFCLPKHFIALVKKHSYLSWHLSSKTVLVSSFFLFFLVAIWNIQIGFILASTFQHQIPAERERKKKILFPPSLNKHHWTVFTSGNTTRKDGFAEAIVSKTLSGCAASQGTVTS